MVETIRTFISDVVCSNPWTATIFSFILGYLLMPTVLKISIKKNMVVKPNKRSSHKGLIPNVGGTNIFTTFFISFLIFAVPPILFSSFTSVNKVNANSQMALAGFFCIFAVGFVDDLIDISAKKKFLGELIAAFIIVVMADIRLTNFHGLLFISDVTPDFIWLSYLVSAFLFVLLTNSINLIDGVDGLATSIGILISLFFGIFFQNASTYEYINGNIDVSRQLTNLSIMAYSLIGSLAIFFIYNVFGGKRKIFMGDSGSLMLGAVIYVFVITFCQYNVNIAQAEANNPLYIYASPAVAACVLAVPLFDTLRVMITRLKNGTSPFKADKRHAHHLLLSLGLKHWQVTTTLVAVDATFIALGIAGKEWHNWVLGSVAIAIAIIYTVVLWKIVNRHNSKIAKKENQSLNIK